MSTRLVVSLTRIFSGTKVEVVRDRFGRITEKGMRLILVCALTKWGALVTLVERNENDDGNESDEIDERDGSDESGRNDDGNRSDSSDDSSTSESTAKSSGRDGIPIKEGCFKANKKEEGYRRVTNSI